MWPTEGASVSRFAPVKEMRRKKEAEVGESGTNGRSGQGKRAQGVASGNMWFGTR